MKFRSMKNEITEKINSLVYHSSLEEAHVQHLFALARKLIEEAPIADRVNYSLLKFYSDWTLHSEIDRSREGALVVARIHTVILDHLKRTDNSNMADDLTAALSLNETREQLNALISKSGGDTDLFSKAKWSEIIPILAEIISRCILKIGNHSRLSHILQLVKSKPLKGTSVVEELSIIKIPSTTFNASAPKEELTYCFLINTTDTTKFVTPLTKIN